ncbi:chemotaxis protein CheW [Paenibacillus lentus]|uniref:chemotaxis protein CheW n=1 Tax=Paenibacillus lentus TaxID=1338368 RepID=UPI00365D51B1
MAQQQYIEFAIEEEPYAIHIQDIYEIIRLQDITHIPNVTFYVEGVINLRGTIIPVINLRRFFGLEERAHSRATRIIVVHHQEGTVGIIVDRVNKVAKFKDIQAPPKHIGGIDSSYFVGIGLSDNGLVGILKLDEILLYR